MAIKQKLRGVVGCYTHLTENTLSSTAYIISYCVCVCLVSVSLLSSRRDSLAQSHDTARLKHTHTRSHSQLIHWQTYFCASAHTLPFLKKLFVYSLHPSSFRWTSLAILQGSFSCHLKIHLHFLPLLWINLTPHKPTFLLQLLKKERKCRDTRCSPVDCHEPQVVGEFPGYVLLALPILPAPLSNTLAC